MTYFVKALVCLVALEHIYILIMEMFLWTKPRTLKVFGLTREFAEATTVLAANQGLYNGFLAAGLLWGVLHPNSYFGLQISAFFLSCVLIAAMYGAATVKTSILIIQGLPALFAFCCVTFLLF